MVVSMNKYYSLTNDTQFTGLRSFTDQDSATDLDKSFEGHVEVAGR